MFRSCPRCSEREALQYEVVKENSKGLVKQLAEISDNAKGSCSSHVNLTILNNEEWFQNVSLVSKSTVADERR